jgi:hypothetical protein
MPKLPRPGQKVRWHDPSYAHAWGWDEVFGPDPFEVVGMVDNSDRGLAAGLIVQTRLGETEIPEVWLALADEPGNDSNSRLETEVPCTTKGSTSC